MEGLASGKCTMHQLMCNEEALEHHIHHRELHFKSPYGQWRSRQSRFVPSAITRISKGPHARKGPIVACWGILGDPAHCPGCWPVGAQWHPQHRGFPEGFRLHCNRNRGGVCNRSTRGGDLLRRGGYGGSSVAAIATIQLNSISVQLKPVSVLGRSLSSTRPV